MSILPSATARPHQWIQTNLITMMVTVKTLFTYDYIMQKDKAA